MSRLESRATDNAPVGANIGDPTGGNAATAGNEAEEPKPNSARIESLWQPEEHKTSKMDHQPVMFWLGLDNNSQAIQGGHVPEGPAQRQAYQSPSGQDQI